MHQTSRQYGAGRDTAAMTPYGVSILSSMTHNSIIAPCVRSASRLALFSFSIFFVSFSFFLRGVSGRGSIVELWMHRQADGFLTLRHDIDGHMCIRLCKSAQKARRASSV